MLKKLKVGVGETGVLFILFIFLFVIINSLLCFSKPLNKTIMRIYSLFYLFSSLQNNKSLRL